MKNASLFLCLIAIAFTTVAQGGFNNQTNNTLEKVVRNYPSQFKAIKGEQISSTAMLTEYKSTIAIPGAISTTITQSAAPHRSMVSWQSVVFEGNEFKLASTRFEELFNQIKNTIVKPEGENAAIVNGFYMPPSEAITFNTIQFDLLPANATLQNVNIDLALKHIGKQWKIILSVYDRDMKESESYTAR